MASSQTESPVRRRRAVRRSAPGGELAALRRALRDSERRYRELFDRANDAMIIYEPKTLRILAANRRALAVYGFSRRALIGMNLARLSADIRMESRRLRAVLRGKRHRAFETTRYRRDGAPIILVVDAAAIEYRGRRAILSISRDVTAQRVSERALQESEQRLRAAIEGDLDALYILESVRDARGRIVDFRYVDLNRRGAELVFRRREDVIGRRLCELFPTARTLGFFRKFARVADTGKTLVEDFPVPGRQVRATWLFQQVVKLGDGVAVTARDITDRKRIEEELKALPRRIIAAQEAERERVARELHDGVSQLLASARFRMKSLDGLLPELGEAPRAQLAAAGGVLDKALQAVRGISHGLRPTELDDLGLVAALRGLLLEFRERTGVETTWRGPRQLANRDGVAEATLYRIAQEALTNVERHARAGRVWLDLSRANGDLALVVRDDGRGFRQSEDRRTTKGLGLLHMRERAELLGGTFWLNSAPGEGAAIEARIPLARAKEQTHE